jgi:hypothetical protein
MARLSDRLGKPGRLTPNPGMAGSVGSAGIGGIGMAKLRLSAGNAQFDTRIPQILRTLYPSRYPLQGRSWRLSLWLGLPAPRWELGRWYSPK